MRLMHSKVLNNFKTIVLIWLYFETLFSADRNFHQYSITSYNPGHKLLAKFSLPKRPNPVKRQQPVNLLVLREIRELFTSAFSH